MASQPTRALVRGVARSYQDYYARRNKALLLSLADEQHKNYVQALEGAGLSITVVEADDDYPDCVFIEDTTVVWDGQALITRMKDEREGEQVAVERELRKSYSIHHLPPGATLEGGDVMHLGDATYVGISTRTNDAGANALREFLGTFDRRVVFVPVDQCLHLKTGVTAISEDAIAIADKLIDPEYFQTSEVIRVNEDEPSAANCLRVGNFLIIAAGYPKTFVQFSRFADKNGLTIIEVPISEFETGEGSITCMSVLLQE